MINSKNQLKFLPLFCLLFFFFFGSMHFTFLWLVLQSGHLHGRVSIVCFLCCCSLFHLAFGFCPFNNNKKTEAFILQLGFQKYLVGCGPVRGNQSG